MNESVAKFVQGSRLSLRSLRTEDIPLITTWFNSLPNRKYGRTFFPMSNEEITKFAMKSKPSESIYFGVWHDQDKIMIGFISLMHISLIDRNAMIGLEIGNSSYWRKGYGTEALGLITKYGFEDLNLHRIEGGVYEGNIGSMKCFERNLYRLESIQKEKLRMEGKYLGNHVYVKFEEDYFNSR